MKKTKMFLLLIAMLFAITLASCGGGGGGGDGGGGGATPAPTSVNLPKTGQTTNYATGDDGDLERGVAWPSQRFTVDGTGFCVTDNLTGLMWVGIPGGSTATWQNALNYANGLTFCGYTDWRLPNVNEMESLLNAGQDNTATWLNSQGFSLVQSSYYWTSSTNASNTTYAWIVGMVGGDVLTVGKTTSYYVWPVRAGGGAPADLPKTGQTTSYATGDDGDLERGVALAKPEVYG